MRSFDMPNEPQRQQNAGTTIRMADYQTQPGTRTSWSEVQIRREEIRLPNPRRDERR